MATNFQLSLNSAKQSASKKRQEHTRAAVAWAVRSGKLVRPNTCDQCGKTSKIIHGHHPDYRRPLAVRWLCPQCHPSAHQALRWQWPDPHWEDFQRRLREHLAAIGMLGDRTDDSS